MKHSIIVSSIAIFSVICATLAPSSVLASATVGTIDVTYKYAWSENLGWINFGTAEGNVQVRDAQLTGYAWNQNTGWINLAVSTSTYVANDAEGNLSGYAWGEGIGYIDFSGVTIDSSGYFHGYASSTLGGRISFNCLNNNSCGSGNFSTKTDWLKASLRSPATINNGGGSPSAVIASMPHPQATPSVIPTLLPSPVPTKIVSIPTPTSNACAAYLTKYIRFGKKNDVDEVKKLQIFLNKYEGSSSLKISGTYDKASYYAVVSFQTKYNSDILGPWNRNKPTGYVYKTTIKKINELYCSYNKVLQ